MGPGALPRPLLLPVAAATHPTKNAAAAVRTCVCSPECVHEGGAELTRYGRVSICIITSHESCAGVCRAPTKCDHIPCGGVCATKEMTYTRST